MSNKVTIIGRIATNLVLQEVDVHGTKTKVCNFRVAVDDPHQGTLPNGAASVQFFKVAVWRNNAVALVKHMVKGNLIAITGTVVHSQFKGNNGTIFNNLEIKNPEVLFLPLLIHAYNQGTRLGALMVTAMLIGFRMKCPMNGTQKWNFTQVVRTNFINTYNVSF